MTVIMHDAREAYFRQCAEQNFERASTYMERHFGFQDVEFADDTNLIQTHLPSLRVLTRCYLCEARYYGFSVNNDPREGKCYILAFHPDMPNVVVQDLDGRPFPVVQEANTLGLVYGRENTAAQTLFRERIGTMQSSMNQYKPVWQCTLPVNEKTLKMNALVWNKVRWSLHLFPMTKTLGRSIDAAPVRFLRRILKVPAAYISRVSHKEIRRRCSTFRFSTFIFRAQLRWLGHMLRTPADDPLRRVLFEPHSPLRPARPPSMFRREQRQRVGRPPRDWAQSLFHEIYQLTQTSRTDIERIAQDRRLFHSLVERLCALFDRT